MANVILRKLFIGVVIFLTACSSGYPKVDSKSDLARYPKEVFKNQGLRARYADATSLNYSVQHGTQIEYTSKDGRAYLWYPGNVRLVIGIWRTETDKFGDGRICFKYPDNSYNPVTYAFVGNWDCVRAADFIWAENEFSRGDPLSLSSGRIPYVIAKDKKKLTFSGIGKKARVKITPSL